MIQNCLTEPIPNNALLPSYPLFIALQNTINSIPNKKSIKEIKIDINSVTLSPIFSSFNISAMREKDSSCSASSKDLIWLNSRKKQTHRANYISSSKL